MAIKNWHHSSLAVSDLDKAMNFYCRAFGFELDFSEKGMSDQIASIVGQEGVTCDIAQLRNSQSEHILELIAFHVPRSASMASLDRPMAPGMAHVAFYVEDLDAMMRQVEALGAVRLGEITQFSDGRSVYYREPAGSFFEMEQAAGDGP